MESIDINSTRIFSSDPIRNDQGELDTTTASEFRIYGLTGTRAATFWDGSGWVSEADTWLDATIKENAARTYSMTFDTEGQYLIDFRCLDFPAYAKLWHVKVIPVTEAGTVVITENTLDTESNALGNIMDDGVPQVGARIYAYLASDTDHKNILFQTETDGDGGYALVVETGATYHIVPVVPGKQADVDAYKVVTI